MTTLRTELDPQLHILRSITRAVADTRLRHELESARFNLFAALEATNLAAARQWIGALRVSLDTAPAGQWSVATERSIAAALAEIESALENSGE